METPPRSIFQPSQRAIESLAKAVLDHKTKQQEQTERSEQNDVRARVMEQIEHAAAMVRANRAKKSSNGEAIDSSTPWIAYPRLSHSGESLQVQLHRVDRVEGKFLWLVPVVTRLDCVQLFTRPVDSATGAIGDADYRVLFLALGETAPAILLNTTGGTLFPTDETETKEVEPDTPEWQEIDTILNLFS